MFFKIDSEIFNKNKSICAGVIIAEGLENNINKPEIDKLLSSQTKEENEALKNICVKDIKALEQYRQNMKLLGINPAKYPCSIEALLTRIAKNGELPSINPVVDLCNYISIKYKLPVGVHDRDTFNGDLCIRNVTEKDLNNKDEDSEDISIGEPVYAANGSIRTRRWIWRQMPKGRITEDAKNVIIPIDGFDSNKEIIIKACDELSMHLEKIFNCRVRVGMLDIEHPEIKISELNDSENEIEDTIKIMLKGVADHTSVTEIRETLYRIKKENRHLRIKLGLDPTAPDIHLGHSVVLRKIRQLQSLGHKAIIIIGDFTGKIGDPSMKSKTRNQLTEDEVQINAKTYTDQIYKILDKNKTEVCFNSKWLSPMTFEDVIKLTAKSTVARILERDDFKKRYENSQSIGMHEFIYPFLQGYDSVAIQADIELGGTDQTFNILFGRDIQRSYGQVPQITLFMPLLEGIDGKEKMSKSLGNYIGINEDPAVIYEKVMKIPDSLIIKYYNLCTDLHPDAVEKIERRMSGGENPRDIKMELAFEITRLYCGDASAQSAQKSFEDLFQNNTAPANTQILDISSGTGTIEERIIEALYQTKKFESKSAIRRLVSQGGIQWNGEKVLDLNSLSCSEKEGTLRAGKRNIFIIKL